MAETAPFGAPPLDLDDNEHAIRRISTPLITMGGLSRKCSVRVDELVSRKFTIQICVILLPESYTSVLCMI